MSEDTQGHKTMAEGQAKKRPAAAEGKPQLRVIRGDGALPLHERGDEELMLAHGKDCEEAFAELVRRHQRGVLNYVYRMVQDRQVAEELTQEVFLALVKNAKRYQPTAKFTTYLYAIASNIVSKEWLRRKRRPSFLSLSMLWGGPKDEGGGFDPMEHVRDTKVDVADDFRRQEINEAVNKALQELPAHQREAFVLRRFQDLSYDEIAEVTNSPVGTIKSRVVRAERALRPLLGSLRQYL